ncbi:Glycerol kinase [Rubellimicrobium thermophilum DSM 16684]|uniref:Glycerol kinase n=2 Tax=Rubellimicrobium TaxID=295418 RepID=S9QTZ1_9RHOB|nr:Glycerol kinase [Rubellimicrobium thermophilum DSM 16684]
MNLARLDWDEDLCALYGVPPDCLPRIVPSTGDLGILRAGGRAIPLRASLVDQQAATWGHGCRRPGDTKITFGTGAFAFALAGERPPADPQGALPTLAWARAGEAPIYALDGGVYTAGAAVEWARGLGLFGDVLALNDLPEEPAIARGLAFVPALAGLACPHWNRRARGAWLGMDLATGPRDLVQAMLEGIAFRMAEVIEAMDRVVPIRDPISIDGGLSANPWFCGLLAAVLGRPLRISEEPELTALGTARLAAEAAGLAVVLRSEGRLVQPPRDLRPWRARFAAARAAVEVYGMA